LQVEFLEIDGAHGEGGGSIVRTALSLSALTGQAVRISNVRGGLQRPGVNPVDLALLRVFTHCTDAVSKGDLGDAEILFQPRTSLRPYRGNLDIGKVARVSPGGSATLIAQTLVVPLSQSGRLSGFRLRGGTHVPYAPTHEYLELVTLPALAEAGIGAWSSLSYAGYVSGGSGEIEMEIEPSALCGFDFSSPGELVEAKAVLVTSELPEHVRSRGVDRLEELARRDGLALSVRVLRPQASGPGAAVTIAARMERGFGGGQSLGQRGKPIEEVVEEAYSEFIEFLNSGCGVDDHLADQLVLPAALCRERATFTISRITRTLATVVWVVKQFIPIRLTLLGRENERGEIRVEP
jgi:RNA 3'-terminal phosphate cyclase (ATP)